MKVKFTINKFNEKYPDDTACLDEIFKSRYGKMTSCPSCNKKTNFYKIISKKVYSCQFCGYQISPLAGTIFHKSSTSLKNWFYAIYKFSTAKNGVSAKELERELGVTYKTAWRMASQIRKLFADNIGELSGVVEVDEYYHGGVKKGQRGKNLSNKKSIVGMAERQGRVLVKVVEDTTKHTVWPLIVNNIKQGSHVMTDNAPLYNKVTKLGYDHSIINHSLKKYVFGDIYTNTIEGFWSQLKRSVNGTYHAVSPKFLQTYVNEFSFRYSNRFSSISMFDLLLGQVLKLSK
jgi:transposase-like protein